MTYEALFSKFFPDVSTQVGTFVMEVKNDRLTRSPSL